MIEVKHINKSFGGKPVLKDVSAVFEPGKISMIIGRSGSGKTVFLKSVIGLHMPESGEIYFDDVEFVHATTRLKLQIRRKIGMVFQGGALFTSSTVLENVMFPLDMFSDMSRQERILRAEACLERVGVQNAGQLYPAEISGGMQKRVAIARAIAMNPNFLFCDEPNSGLDPQTAILIDKLIHDITTEYNITTVINTHDMNSIMGIADNINFIFKGENIWQGSRNDIFTADNKELNDFVFASELFKKVKRANV